MYNTIILLKGEARLNDWEYQKFTKGDTIFCFDPEELERWRADDIDKAKAELAKYHCSYTKDVELHNVTEYALEYCECDENRDFVSGSDYDFAEEETK